MTGCTSSIWKILSAVGALALMLPRLVLGEFGVCPPYSKTFGPDDPPAEIESFLAEINLRPGGGTVKLEPGEYTIGALSVSGVVCIQPSMDEPAVILNSLGIRVEAGATFTLKSLTSTSGVSDPRIMPWDDMVHVAEGATFFGENLAFHVGAQFTNYGFSFLRDVSMADDWIGLKPRNFGTMIWRGGTSSADDPSGANLPFEGYAFLNEGWALVDQVRIEVGVYCGYTDCASGEPVVNRNGGVLTLVRVVVPEACYALCEMWDGDDCVFETTTCVGGVRNGSGSTLYVVGSTVEAGPDYFSNGVSNAGQAEISRSIIGKCGDITDAGYNVFGDDSCPVTQPTSIQADPEFLPRSLELSADSPAIDLIPLELCEATDALGRARTDGNGDGVVACDSGALEYGYVSVPVTVRTVPYWREVGRLDLSRDAALFVSVFSTASFDATSILFDTIDIEGLSDAARRGPVLQDANRDGWQDIAFWYRLDRMPRLACGSYDQRFEAMTEGGRLVSGQLRFEVVGCAP